MLGRLVVRPASRQDVLLILHYIRALAAHEGRPDAAVITVVQLDEALFGPRPLAEGFILESAGRPIGYAIIQEQFATFTGRKKLYLEDVLIDPAHRGRGLGTAFMHWLFDLARQRGCAAVDWACVENNPRAMALYERLGAKRKSGVVGYRYDLMPSRP